MADTHLFMLLFLRSSQNSYSSTVGCFVTAPADNYDISYFLLCYCVLESRKMGLEESEENWREEMILVGMS